MDTKLLKELANQNITKILDAFGFQYTDNYSYLSMPCPIHGGDNPTAFSWVKDKGYFRCFTHKCEKGGSDIFDFIRKLKKCSFASATNIVKSIIIEDNYSDADQKKLTEEMTFNQFIRGITIKKKSVKAYNPEMLKALQSDWYFTERGLSSEILKEFQVGYCDRPGARFYRYAIIPIFNENNILVGFTGRATFDYKAEKLPKWNHTEHFPASEVLFNLNRAKEHIRKLQTAIIVEGPIDVMKLEMAGIKNAVAIFGTSFSTRHRSLLLEHECYDLILAFDNDPAGINCTNDVIKDNASYFAMSKYQIPEGKDIGDLSVEEIQNLYIIKV